VVEGEADMTHYMDLLRKKMLEVSNGEWKIVEERKEELEHEITVEYVPKVVPFPIMVRAVYRDSGDRLVEWDKRYYCDVQIGSTKIRVWGYSLELLFDKLRYLFSIVEYAEVVK
jgi:hypothetical protein